MEHKYDEHYRNLDKMVTDFHEKQKKRLKVSGIILLILPVVLGFMRWITDSDKVVFLLIWVLCMFAVSAYLVSVEYMDESHHRILLRPHPNRHHPLRNHFHQHHPR